MGQVGIMKVGQMWKISRKMLHLKMEAPMYISDEIKEIQTIILNTVPALQIYLFGSCANEMEREGSDYDFYVVIPDNTMRPLDATRKISMALRPIRKRPIDILVGSESKFNKYKTVHSIEKEVLNTGIKLYG